MKTIKLKSGDEYILDDEIIIAEIVKTGFEIRLILKDIIQEESTGAVNMLNWINNSLVATSPERRWAALEVNTVGMQHLVLDCTEPDILLKLGEALISDAEKYNDNDIIMGTRDAIGLVKAITPMVEELGEEWLWYATSDCPVSRYCSIMTTLMTISYGILKLKIESK